MKKILSITLAVCLGILALTGCASTPDVIKMGTNAAFPPYEYKEGVHERTEKWAKTAEQQIDIYFRYVGCIVPAQKD